MLKFWRKSQQGAYVTLISEEDALIHTMPYDDVERGVKDHILHSEFMDYQISSDPKDAQAVVLHQDAIDDIVPPEARKTPLSRGVSFRNFFYYNPGLYEDLMEAASVLPDYVTFGVSLSDMPDLRDVMAKMKVEADTSDGKFYR
jgi:hypothetical protein